MKPPQGVTSQGKFWIFELGRKTWTVTAETADPGKSKGKYTEQIPTLIGDMMYPCRYWPTTQSQHISSTCRYNTPDPHPIPDAHTQYTCTPSTEVADYETSKLHYIDNTQYSINTSNENNRLTDKHYKDKRQKYAPPLHQYTQHMTITNSAILTAMNSPTIAETPLPEHAKFPSDRQTKEMWEINDTSCTKCNRSGTKIDLIKCDANECGKAYCKKCLGITKFPKSWLVWDPKREKNKMKTKEATAKYDVLVEREKERKNVSYIPFFSKICHPASDLDSSRGVYPPRYEDMNTEYTPEQHPKSGKKQRQDNDETPITQEKNDTKKKPEKTIKEPKKTAPEQKRKRGGTTKRNGDPADQAEKKKNEPEHSEEIQRHPTNRQNDETTKTEKSDDDQTRKNTIRQKTTDRLSKKRRNEHTNNERNETALAQPEQKKRRATHAAIAQPKDKPTTHLINDPVAQACSTNPLTPDQKPIPTDTPPPA
jgi:hypothetical protein